MRGQKRGTLPAGAEPRRGRRPSGDLSPRSKRAPKRPAEPVMQKSIAKEARLAEMAGNPAEGSGPGIAVSGSDPRRGSSGHSTALPEIVNGALSSPVPLLNDSSESPDLRTIEGKILDLLSRRKQGATICPSEVARALASNWRPLMDTVRAAAADMVDRGLVRITQRGQDVLPGARGPIRIALPREPTQGCCGELSSFCSGLSLGQKKGY